MFRKRLYYAVTLVVLLLSIGTFYYHNTEGWSYVNAFYFSTMTLTTIGYGDLYPTTEGGKIFTSFYAIFGIGIMLYILSSVVGGLVFQQERRFSRIASAIRRIAKPEEDNESSKKLEEHEKEIRKLKKEVRKAPPKEDFERQEREVRKLKRQVKPIKEQEKDIERLEKRIRNASPKEDLEEQKKELASLKRQVSRKKNTGKH